MLAVPSMRRHSLSSEFTVELVDRLRAILPSALLVSPSSGSVHSGVRRGPVLPTSNLSRHEKTRDGQRHKPQSPGPGGQARSAFRRDRDFLLRCRDLVIMRSVQWVVRFSVLNRYIFTQKRTRFRRGSSPLLGILATVRGDTLPVPSQIAIWPERSQDAVRALNQQGAQISVSGLGNR